MVFFPYDSKVPGNEGRAGMAAILDQEDNLDLQAVAEGVRRALPAYARPQFIRALRQVEMTGMNDFMIGIIFLL